MLAEAPTIDISQSFAFFGLEQGVKQKTYKEAFRRYVKEFHPDLFPAGSDAQKMAQEKIVEANQHAERLKAYFEKVANSPPEAKAAKPKEEPKNQDDWVDWEQQRHEAWDVELRDWIARKQKAELDKVRARRKKDKKWLVYSVRGFVAISLLVGWNGYFAENAQVEAKKVERQHQISAAQATGNQTDLQWVLHTIDVEDHGIGGFDDGAHWDKRFEEQPYKIFPMIFWTVVGLLALFSKRAIDYANKLLEKPGMAVMLRSKEAK